MFKLMFVVFMITEFTVANKEDIIGIAAQCILDTIPYDILKGKYLNWKFETHISSQWNPLNPHDYLEWPVYDGPEEWAVSCRFSTTIKQCLLPLRRFHTDLDVRFSEHPMVVAAILPALYYLALCEHQATLTDPRTNNAQCVHQRILSDDVQRCAGLISWFRSNMFLILNKAEIKDQKWLHSAVRGNWRHSCGAEVESMMQNLTKIFSSLTKLNPMFSMVPVTDESMCDICKPETDLKTYVKVNLLRIKLVELLLVKNQNPFLFKQCQVVNFPLNQCHLRLIWREGVYNMFCHKVINKFIPEVKPYLPLCDIGDWIRSAVRICNMGYGSFMDTASHIARCTKDEDKLFPCYKGAYMDYLSWGLVLAGRLWSYVYRPPHLYRRVYNKTKICSSRLYDHLRQTCRSRPSCGTAHIGSQSCPHD